MNEEILYKKGKFLIFSLYNETFDRKPRTAKKKAAASPAPKTKPRKTEVHLVVTPIPIGGKKATSKKA